VCRGESATACPAAMSSNVSSMASMSGAAEAPGIQPYCRRVAIAIAIEIEIAEAVRGMEMPAPSTRLAVVGQCESQFRGRTPPGSSGGFCQPASKRLKGGCRSR
jgi:hypothetical protein